MYRHHNAPLMLRMQPPTCTGIRVRSVRDAHILFHSVYLGMLPMVTRRLDTEERRAVRAGNVYVWEERGRSTEATGLGIERWTDGIRWSASRVRDEFLLYHERESGTEYDSFTDNELGASYRLVKQTYSVFVDTNSGRRKWHLTAYFVPASVNQLRTVDDIPELAGVQPPEGMYTSAKMGKSRARGDSYPADIHGAPHMSVVSSEQHFGSTQPLPLPPASAPPAYAHFPTSHFTGPEASPVGSPVSTRSPPPWPVLPASLPTPPAPPPGRESHILPNPARILPSLRPAPPVQSPYSPRHPLDDEALRSLGRNI